jgi:hypothetical protein
MTLCATIVDDIRLSSLRAITFVSARCASLQLTSIAPTPLDVQFQRRRSVAPTPLDVPSILAFVHIHTSIEIPYIPTLSKGDTVNNEGSALKSTLKSTLKTEDKILEIIKQDERTSYDDMADILGMSRRGIAKQIG